MSIVENKREECKYAVQMRMITHLGFNAWVNASWTHDGSQRMFNSVEEAQAEIKTHCSHFSSLFGRYTYFESDYRVVFA